jgi:20S proteasome subunit beta 5
LRSHFACSSTIMNTFVNRFASTSAANELRDGDDDGAFSDAMWGSEAGFGSLAKGVPTFTVPAVPDVSLQY